VTLYGPCSVGTLPRLADIPRPTIPLSEAVVRPVQLRYFQVEEASLEWNHAGRKAGETITSKARFVHGLHRRTVCASDPPC